MHYPKPFDRITVDPGLMGGAPCIRNMRITVSNVLVILNSFPSRADLFRNYPGLEEEDLQQALLFAEAAREQTGFPLQLAS